MSNEQMSAKTPSEPVLCKMGCGFFGSGATGDCCSKCWRENMKKQGEVAAVAAPAPEPKPVVKAPAATSEPQPMDIDVPAPVEEAKAPAAAAAAVPVKKKKKKASYKSLMAGMLQSSPERDVEKEKEQLRKVTGGGTFSKIDKI